MTIERDIEALRQVMMFSELNSEQLRLLAFSAESVKLAPKEILFQEGDVAGSGFVVTEGEIQLLQRSDGRSVSVGRLGQGSVVNELALISETLRPATAIATQASEVIKIRRSLFGRFINEYPDIAVRLEQSLRGRLQETIGQLKRAQRSLKY
ncbi:MAG: cyclic nucleotide-binding domain-containing protein [Alphaproteobacteria bacterium]|nr:cyclic nucleotide-binding domain-containing protein [Alphaproteobacteria bacterium]